jgi:type II secretory ATPase GspE/PulE/Tfp pilus assembly ATPase PilB-like protein
MPAMNAWPSDTVSLVDALLGEAVSQGASDLHLVPGPAGLSARLRIDGCLHDLATFPDPARQRVPARLKVLAGLPTYETDLPQEGRTAWQGREFRVASFPTVHGERLVVRLFDPRHLAADLDALGLPEDVCQGLKGALARRGAVFLTGPSGSGKTTVIYACLRHLVAASGGRSILTIEDPVECPVPGVSQTEVAPARGLTFARALRSALRQDPEVLVVGEIRDAETAGIAVEAALTGHLVISTIHAGSAAGVYSRLLEMGIPGHLLTSSIAGILALRLLRRACPGCRGVAVGVAGTPACRTCLGRGYAGRMPLAEWLMPDASLNAAVARGEDTQGLLKAALASGLLTFEVRARRAVAAGETTAGEVSRTFGGELPSESAARAREIA